MPSSMYIQCHHLFDSEQVVYHSPTTFQLLVSHQQCMACPRWS
jgi:hypothetical protein